MTQYEREEEQLIRDLDAGLISPAEYARQVQQMERDMRDEMRASAQEAAERAYSDALGDW